MPFMCNELAINYVSIYKLTRRGEEEGAFGTLLGAGSNAKQPFVAKKHRMLYNSAYNHELKFKQAHACIYATVVIVVSLPMKKKSK